MITNVPITVGSLHWVMSLWHRLSEIMQKLRKWFRNAVVMQSSNDVHPLCEFDIRSTRTLQSYEPRLLSGQVWRLNIIFSCQLEIRVTAVFTRRENSNSGWLNDWSVGGLENFAIWTLHPGYRDEFFAIAHASNGRWRSSTVSSHNKKARMGSFCFAWWIFHIIGNPFNCTETAERVAKAMIGAKVITRLRFAIFVLFSNFAPNFSLFKCL